MEYPILMDPDKPGLSADELQEQFGAVVRIGGESGYKSFTLFLNEDIFRQEVGFWNYTNMSPQQLREVLTHFICTIPAD